MVHCLRMFNRNRANHLFLYIFTTMDPIYYYLFGGTLLVFGLLAWYLSNKNKKELMEEAMRQQQAGTVQKNVVRPSQNPEMLRLQLQAYERLIILCDRLDLTNLIGRFQVNQLSATQLQSQLIQTIKTEFEYNVSQQMYVSATAWDAVKNLKEQNIFIINQLAAMLPANANGMDLSKKLVELLAQDENVSLQPIVAGLLNTEARQLMQG
jgi:hypothetical protein